MIKKEKIKHYIKEIVFFLIALVVVANVVSYFRSGDLNKEKIHTINFTLLDNKKFKYDETKPLLVHYWATWCPICKVEAPNIQAISKEYQVLTIAVDSGSEQKIKEYLKENNLDFAVVNDINREFANRSNIKVYPTTFIYNKNKELIFSEVGYTSTLALRLRMIWASF